jgi:hypothetical protein
VQESRQGFFFSTWVHHNNHRDLSSLSSSGRASIPSKRNIERLCSAGKLHTTSTPPSGQVHAPWVTRRRPRAESVRRASTISTSAGSSASCSPQAKHKLTSERASSGSALSCILSFAPPAISRRLGVPSRPVSCHLGMYSALTLSIPSHLQLSARLPFFYSLWVSVILLESCSLSSQFRCSRWLRASKCPLPSHPNFETTIGKLNLIPPPLQHAAVFAHLESIFYSLAGHVSRRLM